MSSFLSNSLWARPTISRIIYLIFFLIFSFGFLLPKGETVSYYNKDGKAVKGFIAYPDSKSNKGKYPAMILIHEWWGLNDDIKSKAELFAKEGYVALAVDLYNGESTANPNEARQLAGKVRANMEDAFANLKAAVAYLKKDPKVRANNIGAVGWCFGGGWSYQMAKNNLGVKASVIYYGPFNPKDDLSIMRASILGHFAEKDRFITVDNVKEFQVKLKNQGEEHEVYIYPNTQHGFASREGNNPIFSKKEADLAWERTLNFLNKFVKN